MKRRKVEKEEEEEHRSKRCRFDHHSLPDDLIREILLRLPAKSVGRLRCATKSWLSITTAPSFVHAHSLLSPKSFLAKSLQPCSNVNCRHYRTVQLVSSGQAYTCTTHDVRISGQALASCNGLLFLGHRIRTRYFVLNPLTGFRIDLANPPVPFQCDRTCSGFGFYFHRWSGEHRVLNVYQVQWGGIKAVVHSLGGGDSWRQIQATEPMVRMNSQSSVLVNDCLHWFCQDASDHGLLLILVFDVREETFRLMKPPPYCGRCCMFCVKKAVTKDLGMVDMEGKLGCWIAKGDVMRIELWVAGDDAGGEVDGWRKMYSLCCDGDCREIWLSGYDVRSAVYIRGEVWLIFGGKLVQWDLKEGKCCAMWDLCERFDHLCPPAMIYRETLISPVFFFSQVALTMPALPSFS